MRRTVAKPRHPEMYLPTFRTDEEERAFWEKSNPGDYLPSTRRAQVQVSRRIRERVRERSNTWANLILARRWRYIAKSCN